MKTYDEVYDNIIEATNAHKQKMRKIQNAVSVSAVCLTCIFGVGMFLKLERPMSHPSVTEETTTMTTSEMTDMIDSTASAPASSDTAEPSTTISHLVDNEKEPQQTSAPPEQDIPGSMTSTAGHDDKIPGVVPAAEMLHSETTVFPDESESNTYATDSTTWTSSAKETEKATTSATRATTKETSATTKETCTVPTETAATAVTEQSEAAAAPAETIVVTETEIPVTVTEPLFTEPLTENETFEPAADPAEPVSEEPTEEPEPVTEFCTDAPETETTTTDETTTTTTETTTTTTETTATTARRFLIEYNGVYYTPEKWQALFGNPESSLLSSDMQMPENSESSVTTVIPQESENA